MEGFPGRPEEFVIWILWFKDDDDGIIMKGGFKDR